MHPFGRAACNYRFGAISDDAEGFHQRYGRFSISSFLYLRRFTWISSGLFTLYCYFIADRFHHLPRTLGFPYFLQVTMGIKEIRYMF